MEFVETFYAFIYHTQFYEWKKKRNACKHLMNLFIWFNPTSFQPHKFNLGQKKIHSVNLAKSLAPILRVCNLLSLENWHCPFLLCQNDSNSSSRCFRRKYFWFCSTFLKKKIKHFGSDKKWKHWGRCSKRWTINDLRCFSCCINWTLQWFIYLSRKSGK